MNDNIIEIQNFSLSFGTKQVVKDLNFEVRKGEIFGFLGSNGSGKTSTIRALLGIYRPNSGKLLINGEKFSPKKGNLIGYLPEERGLYKKEKVLDIMIYFAQLKGIDRKTAKQWSMDYLKRVGLESKAKTRIDKLSGGQQQKIQLGITIVGQPDILILDEPTKGFDPVNRQLLMDIIEEENKRGATVIMITHQMEEVEKICHRALLLKDGSAKAYGTVDEIRDKFGKNRIILEFSGKLPNSNLYEIIKQETNYAEINPKSDTQEILKFLVDSKLKINKFNIQKSTLNEIFIDLYSDQNQALEEKNV